MCRSHGRVWCLAALGAALTTWLAAPSEAAPGDATAKLVADIQTGLVGSSPSNLFAAGGFVFFSANDGPHGNELWRSNGTAAGTVMLDDDTPANGGINDGSMNSNPSGFATVGNTVYFAANDGCCASDQHGTELWKVVLPNGIPTMVEDINLTLTGSATEGSSPDQLTNVGGTLFFRADDGVDGEELWKLAAPYTDAVPVADINAASGTGSGPDELTEVNGLLFFIADDGDGYEVWKSNGGALGPGGTEMVENIDSGSPGSAVPADLTDVNGTLLFSADDGAHGQELWKSTGPDYDQDSTDIVDDINTGDDGLSPSADLTNVNGTLFFEADDGTNGQDLWKLASPFTTPADLDINPGAGDSDPDFLANVGGTLYLGATGPTDGHEPWKVPPPYTTPTMVEDISPLGSSPARFTGVAGQVFFSAAADGANDNELWKTTGVGATKVAELNTGTGIGSDPQFLTNVGGVLLFSANDGVTGRELWKATIEGPPPPPPPATTPATPAPIPAPAPAAVTKKKCKKKKAKKGASAAKKKHCKKRKKRK